MGTNLERPPQGSEAAALPAPGGLPPSRPAGELSLPPNDDEPHSDEVTRSESITSSASAPAAATLASLPVGARLVVRCRRDWRVATVSSIEPDCVRLSVASPAGHTYRVRRPHDSALTFDGSIPVLGVKEYASWRVSIARYDVRW